MGRQYGQYYGEHVSRVVSATGAWAASATLADILLDRDLLITNITLQAHMTVTLAATAVADGPKRSLQNLTLVGDGFNFFALSGGTTQLGVLLALLNQFDAQANGIGGVLEVGSTTLDQFYTIHPGHNIHDKLEDRVHYSVPGLEEIPFIGPAFFQQHPLVYGVIIFAAALVVFLNKTRLGLILRSVGESPESAHALGYKVRSIRLFAVVAGGALCGLSGAYISLIYTPLWVEGMIAGKGWIALALTTFATWKPMRVLLGAYLFGGVTMLQFHLQSIGVDVPSQLLSMLPYLATIVVLALISRNPLWIKVNMPASIGKPFYPGS